MLTIRDPQLRAFESHAAQLFETRLVARVAEFFPQQARFLGEPRVRSIVQFARGRAAERGYLSQRAQGFYLSLTLMLGAGFESDPQLAFVSTVLSDPRFREPEARMVGLFNQAMRFLDDISGAENEKLVRALLRVRDFDLARFAPPAPGPEAIAEVLTTLYPEKAAVLGDQRLLELGVAGCAGAQQADLDSPGGAMLWAGLAFMLGSSFERDPQFPWVAEALAAPTGRLQKLHAGALAFLRAALV